MFFPLSFFTVSQNGYGNDDMKELNRFVEIVKVYFKYHIFYWIISMAIFCFQLILLFPGLLIFIIAGYGLLMVGKDLHFGWSGDKIRNLIMYKSLTKKELTPLELEVLNKHFGKHERKEIIRDESVKKKALYKVLVIDILMFLLLIPGLMPILTNSESNNMQVYTVTGKVLMVDFTLQTQFMTSKRETRIYFHNGSITFPGEISLEIGKNYTIYYKSKTLEILLVKMWN